MGNVRCVNCDRGYPESGVPYLCPHCNGIFDYSSLPTFTKHLVEDQLPGIWRFRQFFDLFDNAPIVTLGEGNTPLVWDECCGKKIGYKLESLNPTGSYKDRGTAVLVSQLLARGVRLAVEDSSGNAGASFAAYAARTGLTAEIYVPEKASGPKRDQIIAFGANLICVPGPRSAAAAAVLERASKGVAYASHAYLPFGMGGIASIAYELWEELGDFSGSVVAPVGHGSLLLGIIRGFQSLLAGGYLTKMPFFVGVQADKCAPVYQTSVTDTDVIQEVEEGETLAEGVRVRNPIRGISLIKEVKAFEGAFVAVEEKLLVESYKELGLRGVYVEPTSALVWGAVKELYERLPEPIILIMSGSGLKNRTV